MQKLSNATASKLLLFFLIVAVAIGIVMQFFSGTSFADMQEVWDTTEAIFLTCLIPMTIAGNCMLLIILCMLEPVEDTQKKEALKKELREEILAELKSQGQKMY